MRQATRRACSHFAAQLRANSDSDSESVDGSGTDNDSDETVGWCEEEVDAEVEAESSRKKWSSGAFLKKVDLINF